MSLRKEIDALELSTAKEIKKWLLPSIPTTSDTDVKTKVRDFLRVNKLSPLQALGRVEKQTRGMPKLKW